MIYEAMDPSTTDTKKSCMTLSTENYGTTVHEEAYSGFVISIVGSVLSPHYLRKKKGSVFHEYKESHTPKSIKDP